MYTLRHYRVEYKPLMILISQHVSGALSSIFTIVPMIGHHMRGSQMNTNQCHDTSLHDQECNLKRISKLEQEERRAF
jgi:hypothetical protein